MGRDELEVLKTGIVKRRVRRKLGLFIDGVGLDRATRRLNRKVDLSKLVKGLTSGLEPEIARYFTLVPHEDDARQFSFLDAVQRAGLEVVVKRLPPKGVKRQVSMDVHMASDLIAYSAGKATEVIEADRENNQAEISKDLSTSKLKNTSNDKTTKRLAAIICPTRELSYAIYMSHLLGVETSLVDFGLYGQSDGWKGVDKWIDLSTSETIWRD